VIKVGAATETELKREKTAEDAVSATRAAVEEGSSPGWRRPLNSIAALDKVKARAMSGRRQHPSASPGGAAPQIAVNAGLEGSVVVEKVKGLPRARAGRGHRSLRGHGRRRDHRPHQGDPLRRAERRVDRGPAVTTEVLITDIPERTRAAPPQMPDY